MRGNPSSIGYQPSLDGIRAIAIIPVLAIHSLAPYTLGGFIGVDIFFVLSGYLITKLLTNEVKEAGKIDVTRFYLRRARRILPTLILVVSSYLALAPIFFPEDNLKRESLSALFFISDYTRAFWGFPRTLQQTWSLSVEEHFYILWPLILPSIIRLKKPHIALLTLFLFATAWRILNTHWTGYDETYFRFDTRLSGIVLGSLLAVLPTLPRSHSLALPLGIIIIIIPTTRYASDFGLTGAILLAELAAALLICSATDPQHPILSNRILVYVGKLSYGIYLWHFPIFLWLREQYGWRETILAGTTLTVILAMISYHLIDARLRKKFPLQSKNPLNASRPASPPT